MIIERPHPRMRVFREAVSAERCQEIIEQCEQAVNFQASEIADCADPEGKHLRVDARVRTSFEAWVKDFPETAGIDQELIDLVEQPGGIIDIYDQECSAVPKEDRIYDPRRILRYRSGEYFRRHIDIRKVKYGYRAYACLLYLTTHQTGGELIFPTWKGLTIKPEVGTIVMYPASQQYPHEAAAVMHGETKYMLNGWIGYPYQLSHKETMRI